MNLYYLDTSALVKYYFTEPGSKWIKNLIDDQDTITRSRHHLIVIASASITEIAAALAILQRRGFLSKRQFHTEYNRFLNDLVSRIIVIDVIGHDLYQAAELCQIYPLKAYDALQLAVALRFADIVAKSHQSLVFVSGDNTLLKAAATRLTTDNPFNHVDETDMH